MNKEFEKIELRSEEVQEILGHIPGKIIRYGIVVILSIILILFAGSFFFRYPDILSAPAEIISENAPAAISAKMSGNLSNIFVADSQQVAEQTVLALIKNPANYEHIQWLQSHLTNYNNSKSEPFDSLWFNQLPDTLQLGDVQSTFTGLLKAGQEYSRFLQLKVIPRKLASMQKKYGNLKNYIAITERQVQLKVQDYQLSENLFKRDSQLFVKEVVSLSDFEKSRKELLQQGMSLENLRSSLVSAQMQMQDLEQEITNLELEQVEQNEQFIQQWQEYLQTTENALATWTDNYLLISPIEGVVAFNKVWNQNQFVQAGNEIFTIIPKNRTRIIGRITLPVQGSGKVRVGQQVNLKFDNFPYQEFGMVTTKVSAISLVSLEQNYVIEVSLPDTLVTNYGYILPFSQKMTATAEVITEDLPLIVRLFNPLKALLKKHWSPLPVAKTNAVKKELHEAENNVIPGENSQIDSGSDSLPAELTKSDSLNNKDLYYVIAGSFTDSVKAEVEKSRFIDKGYKALLLKENQHYRVGLFGSSNRKEVLRELNRIREKEKNQEIWVLKKP